MAEKSLISTNALRVITGKGPHTIISSTRESNPSNEYGVISVDSHGDISCAGMDAMITSRLDGRTCDVKGFYDSYGSINNVGYVNVMYKYCDEGGHEYLLELNQALDFTETIRHSILCTNQARHNGVIVNDIPRIIDKKSPQCITFLSHNISLPLSMKGPVPIITVSKSKKEDLMLLPKLLLTSEDVLW